MLLPPLVQAAYGGAAGRKVDEETARQALFVKTAADR